MLWGLEALLPIVLTFALCTLAYVGARRLPRLALLLGIQRRAPSVAPLTAPRTVPLASTV